MRTEHTDNSIRRGRLLIDPTLEAIEKQEVKSTARVTTLLKPSERKSIFDRIVFHGSSPDREVHNFKGVTRSDILHAYRIETRARLRAEREMGYIQAKRENLLPPSGPAIAAWPTQRRAA